MNPDRFQKIADIFEAARSLIAAQRTTYLAEACGPDDDLRAEVQALLGAHDSGVTAAGSDSSADLQDDPRANSLGFGGSSALGLGPPQNTTPAMPERVGRYTLVRLVGEGGMGVVYEATQDAPRRRVALKMIRGHGSPEMQRRFEREAHVLGELQHPAIAQIFEAGASDRAEGNHPFFAMEFIEGQPISQYAQDQALGTTDRLQLFARVCDGVAYAHRRGVIHRDLKPANVLVDTHAQPKILDFGVARMTRDNHAVTVHTHVGQLVGTLAYMSPEQLSGRPEAVDHRSDVYALGVMLFELLADRLPHDVSGLSVAESVQIIQTRDPLPLGTYDRRLRGDVETIVGTALEKDLARRYASADVLAADVRRFLADQPIMARPPSTLYQFKKFARRNRAAVIGACCAVAVLIAGVVATAVQLRRAILAEDQAKAQLQAANTAREEAEAVSQFLEDMLTQTDPASVDGQALTLRDVLDAAARQIQEDQRVLPEVRARLSRTIGWTYHQIGEYDQAEDLLREALDLRRQVLGADDPQTRRTAIDLVANYFQLEKIDAADQALQALIESLRQADPAEPELLARALKQLGGVRRRQGNYPEARSMLREAVDLFRELGNRSQTANTQADLANIMARQGQVEPAIALIEEAIEMQKAENGERNAHVAGFLGYLGVQYKRLERYRESEAYFKQELEMKREIHGERHPLIAGCLLNLGMLYSETRRYAEAEPVLREAIEAFRETRGEQSMQIAMAINSLASVLSAQGNLAEAEISARESMEMLTDILGAGHPYVGSAHTGLATIYSEQLRFSDAAEEYKRAVDVYRSALGEHHPHVGVALAGLAASWRGMEDWDRAAATYVDAVETMKVAHGHESRQVAIVLKDAAEIEHERANLEGALPLYEEASAILAIASPDSTIHLLIRTATGECLSGLGRYTEAEEVLLDCQQRWEDKDADAPGAQANVQSLVDLYTTWARPDEAQTWADRLP